MPSTLVATSNFGIQRLGSHCQFRDHSKKTGCEFLLTDDLFSLLNGNEVDSDYRTRVFHPPSNSPVAVLRELIAEVRSDSQLARTATGQLFDMRHLVEFSRQRVEDTIRTWPRSHTTDASRQ